MTNRKGSVKNIDPQTIAGIMQAIQMACTAAAGVIQSYGVSMTHAEASGAGDTKEALTRNALMLCVQTADKLYRTAEEVETDRMRKTLKSLAGVIIAIPIKIDVNGDGVLDMSDILALSKYLKRESVDKSKEIASALKMTDIKKIIEEVKRKAMKVSTDAKRGVEEWAN